MRRARGEAQVVFTQTLLDGAREGEQLQSAEARENSRMSAVRGRYALEPL